ncbi:MAG TPA: hypothetical protein VM165_16885 [Planctomycetaceae bacterium]|nr:hypothetical protein [Planctomycetaceae bacterium]
MKNPPGTICDTVADYPTDAEIVHAEIVAVVDDRFPHWGMVVDPPGASTDDYPKDRIVCIDIDSTSVNIVESWINRIRRLRRKKLD